MSRRIVIIITKSDLDKAKKKRGGKRIHASERPSLMPSRFHGQKSNRTCRRQAKEKARKDGWDV